MLNYLIYLTTIYVKRANLQKNKTKKVCNFFVNFVNLTLNCGSASSGQRPSVPTALSLQGTPWKSDSSC